MLKSHVDSYTRSDGTIVQAHDDKRQAAAPPLGTHAKALRESSKPDHIDHWHNQIAADQMAAGDHKALSGTLKGMDTAARDHVLEHIHPDHHEGLGFKTLNHARSVAGYEKKFPAAKPAAPAGAAKPKPPMSADDVSNHAVSAGAKSKSGVAVFSTADRAHSYSNKSANSKGGAFVMSHPDHSHHVVVSGADSQRMARGGYKYAKPGGSMEKSMLMVRPDLLK
jgi:hypothetical protein